MNRWIIKILVLLSLLSAGCQDDGLVDKVLPVEQPKQAERALITLQGVVGTGPATRTQIDGNRFSWLATDTIGVFYSAASDTLAAPFVVHSLSEDGSTAVFVSLDSLDWRLEDGGYLHAYYPWREGDGRTLTMTVDSVQEQTDAIASHTGRFDYMLADSVGYALPATTLHFRHLVALTDLIFRNTGTEEIGFDSLTITSPQAAWPVQGTIDLLHPAAGVQSIAQATTLKTRVKDGAVAVAPGGSLAVRVVMMPADLSADTMTIRVYTSAGDTLFTKQGLDFRAGKRYIMRLSTEEDDFDRLMAFYRATGGSNWKNNTNWGSDRPLSEWYGVTCDQNGRVTRLSLNNNGLSGEIPVKIGELTELTYLNFEGGQLSGTIPPEIARLTKLYYLNLHANNLSGSIPVDLVQLTDLSTLYLGYNDLEGSLPKELGQLTKLSNVILSNNRFTGELPAEIKALPNWSNFSSSVIPQQDGYGFSLPDDPADRAALLAFYEATGGANWTNNTNWGTDISTNLWYGVRCNENGKVTCLKLRENKLSGEIPAVISGLTELTDVDLFGNQLSGSLPAEIGQLTKLQHILLSFNQLNGNIPAEISQLTELRSLNLRVNQFSGTIPVELGSLTNLYTLCLDHNDLEGSLPKELGQLTELSTFTLSNNRFTGEIPAEITALPNWSNFSPSNIIPQQEGYGFSLTDDAADRNALMAFYEATSGVTWTNNTNWGSDKSVNLWYGVTCDENGKVTQLNLGNNGLFGFIPPAIGELTELTSIVLENNRLSGTIPIELTQLTNLSTLNLNSSGLSGTIPVELSQLTKLSYLNLSNNALSGTIPVELCSLTNLYQLYLNNNNLEGALPMELGQLTRLGYLHLEDNRFSGMIPVELGALTNLYGLDLRNNNLGDALPSELGQLTRLDWLNLSGNRFTGEIPAEIKALPNWSNFSLNNILPQQDGYGFSLPEDAADRNALVAFYEATGGATWTNNTNWGSDKPLYQWYGVMCDENGKVTRLELGSNGLSGSIPAAIGELTELTNVFLGNNQLSGSLPVEIGQLSKLWQLYLHNNNLEGALPKELGQLTGLGYLDLSSNRFSGGIPLELGSLTNLYSLGLNNNNLEGFLPKELGQLTKLNSLGLSNNRFTGEIPAEITALPNWSNFSSEVIPQQDGYGFSLADDAADRNALMAFYEATGGAAWTNNTNWGSDKSVNLWYGVTCDENGKVTQLNLGNNGLFGFIPPAIGELTELTSIVLENNRLSGTIPVELTRLTNLSTLNLHSNELTGFIPVELAQLTKLRYLYLGYNQFTGTIPVELAQLTNLWDLYLNNNNLEGALPVELGRLTGLGYLQLQDNRFSGGIPSEWGKMTSLYGLYLNNNDLEGTLPKELGQLTKLNNFTLSGNRLTGEIPIEITALPNWQNFNPSASILPQQAGYSLTLPEGVQ